MRENVTEVHGAQLSPEIEQTAEDLLIKGLKDRSLRKDIIKNPTWTFSEALDHVRDMGDTDEVLDLTKEKLDVEVNIMQVNKERPKE